MKGIDVIVLSICILFVFVMYYVQYRKRKKNPHSYCGNNCGSCNKCNEKAQK